MINTTHHNEELNPFAFIQLSSILGIIRTLLRKSIWIVLVGMAVSGVILLNGLKPESYKAETVIRIHQIPPSDEYYSEHVSLEAEMESLKSYRLIEDALLPLQRQVTVVPQIGKKEALMRMIQAVKNKMAGGKSKEQGRVNLAYAVIHPALTDTLTLSVREGNQFWLKTAHGDVEIEGEVGQPLSHPMIAVQVEAIYAEPGERFSLTPYTNYDLARHIQSRLQVSRVGLEDFSGLIRVRFEHADKDLVHRFLHEYIHIYRQNTFDRITREMRTRVQQLEGEIAALNAAIAADNVAMEEIETKYTSIDHESEANLLLKNLLEFERRYLEVSSSLEQVQGSFTAKHPTVISLKQQKGILSNKIATIKTKIERIPAIHKEKFTVMHNIEKAKQSQAVLVEDLVRLTSRLESTKNYISIVHEPRTVHVPYLSRMIRNLITGFIFGCLLAVFIITLREASFIKKVRTVKDIEALTHLPVMGELLHKKRKYHLDRLRDLASNMHYAGQAQGQKTVSMLHVKTHATEAMQQLLVEMAASQRVLVIDLDTKHQHLTEHMLQGAHAAGVSEYVLGQHVAADLIKPIKKTLYFLPAGLGMRNYEVLRNVKALSALLEELAPAYDHIMLNMPDMDNAPDHLDELLTLTQQHLLCIPSRLTCSQTTHILQSFAAYSKGVILCDAA